MTHSNQRHKLIEAVAALIADGNLHPEEVAQRNVHGWTCNLPGRTPLEGVVLDPAELIVAWHYAVPYLTFKNEASTNGKIGGGSNNPGT